MTRVAFTEEELQSQRVKLEYSQDMTVLRFVSMENDSL